MQDVKIGRHSFNRKTLTSITKEKALKCFKHIDKATIERAWDLANPKGKKRSPKKTKK